MRQKRIFFLTLFMLLVSATAFAAAPNHIFETGLPVDNFLTMLQEAAQVWAMKIIGIMTIFAALMLGIGAMPAFKSAFQLILGGGLATSFGYFLYQIFEPYILSGSMYVPSDAYNLTITATGDFNVLAKFMNYFIINIIGPGADRIKPFAILLCLALTTIQGTIDLALDAVKGDKAQYLVTTCLKTGMYVWLIDNWVGGSYMIAAKIFATFEKLGLKASGLDMVDVDQIVANAVQSFSVMWDGISLLSLGNLTAIFFALVTIIISFLCLCFVALQIFVARIEFWTVSLFSTVFFAFGTCKFTSFLAQKSVSLVFTHAAKAAILSFMGAIIGPMTASMISGMQVRGSGINTWFNNGDGLTCGLQLLIFSLFMAFLVWKVPECIQGFLTGQPALSGGQMVQMAMNAVATVATHGGRLAGAMASAKAAGGGLWSGVSKYLGHTLPGAKHFNEAYEHINQGDQSKDKNTGATTPGKPQPKHK